MYHFLVQHNLPFVAMDSLAQCIREFSTDSANAAGQIIFDLFEKELKTWTFPGPIVWPLVATMPLIWWAIRVEWLHLHKGFKAGCVLHLVHIAAKRGGEKKGCVADALIETFAYLNLDHKICLKHVQMRWLSIERCVERLVYNWDALTDYFLQERVAQRSTIGKAKAARLATFFSGLTNRLRAYFELFYIRLFSPILVKFQIEEPLVHTLRPAMEKLLRVRLSKLMQPQSLIGMDLTKVNPADQKHQKSKDLSIGVQAMDFYIKVRLYHGRTNCLKLSVLWTPRNRYQIVLGICCTL